jgi:integrase
MRGSLRRKGPSWELRVYLGRDPVSGRKRYATRNVQGARRVAERVLRDMVTAAEAGVTHRAGATFGELCEAWLAHARAHLAANTITETRRILDRFLLPVLGDVALAALRPEHLDDLYARLLRTGGHDGKPLAGSTVRRVHGVARRALTVGVRWGWLATNPALVAMPPRTIRRPIQPPNPDEVARLLATARASDPALATFLVLGVTTGARRGELCGLRWSDLNPVAGHLDIVRAVIIADGQVTLAPTKTRQSRRVALDQITLGELAAHRQRVERRATRAGTALAADAFMFSHANDSRSPWRPDSTSRAFRQLRDQVGLGHLRLHDLRHYVATRLLSAHIDLRTVSGRLGHSKASTTLNVYAAFLPDADRQAARAMARLLPGGRHAGDPVQADKVLGLRQTTKRLSRILTTLGSDGANSKPVVFGRDAHPEAVIISWELWTTLVSPPPADHTPARQHGAPTSPTSETT